MPRTQAHYTFGACSDIISPSHYNSMLEVEIPTELGFLWSGNRAQKERSYLADDLFTPSIHFVMWSAITAIDLGLIGLFYSWQSLPSV